VTIDSFEKFNKGFYIWLDADTESLQPITKNTLKSLLSNEYVIHLFDVSKTRKSGFKAWAAESGFVLINMDHIEWIKLKNFIKEPWMTQIKPEIESWFDGEVLRYATNKIDPNYIHLLNLYATEGKKILDRPWDYMWLSEYIVHHKGRKSKKQRYKK
jgi:hypothetical protein